MEALKLKETGFVSYADLQSWDTAPGERWELFDGVAYQMASPSAVHQDILGELFGQFRDLLKGKPCRPHIAPFEVRLFPKPDDADGDYVEPDLIIVCGSAKMDKRGCKGAPDFIAEVISPSTRSVDMLLKFNKYLDAGVREYWVIDPEAKTIIAHLLKDGHYITRAYGEAPPDAPKYLGESDKTIEPAIFPGCVIDLKALWAAAETSE